MTLFIICLHYFVFTHIIIIIMLSTILPIIPNTITIIIIVINIITIITICILITISICKIVNKIFPALIYIFIPVIPTLLPAHILIPPFITYTIVTIAMIGADIIADVVMPIVVTLVAGFQLISYHVASLLCTDAVVNRPVRLAAHSSSLYFTYSFSCYYYAAAVLCVAEHIRVRTSCWLTFVSYLSICTLLSTLILSLIHLLIVVVVFSVACVPMFVTVI